MIEMDNKIIGAIAVVAILIAAGAAAVVLIKDDGDDNVADSNSMVGRLTVFGNANNDDYINSDDVDEVKAILAGEKEPVYFSCYKEYKGSVAKRSFADANADGTIDETDLQLIQDMVDRKEGMKIYFYDVDGVISSCTYPLTTAAVGYKSNYESLKIIGAVDTVKYICNQVGDNGAYHKWYADFDNDNTKCFGSRFTPDYEVMKDDPPSYILSGTRAWFDSNMESTVAPLGCDVVRLPFWEDNQTVPAIITLGYLTGHEDNAYAYAEKADAVYKTIENELSGVELKDRPLVFASYNGTSISTMHNGIQELVTLAGGRTPIDAGYTSGSIDLEEVADNMNPDWIVLDTYFGFLETYTTLEETKNKEVDQLTNTDNKYVQAIDHTQAYKNGNVLFLTQGVYMGPASYISCAYLANHLYPDRFSFDVDAMFADYVSSYHSDYSASDFAGIEYFDLETLKTYL